MFGHHKDLLRAARREMMVNRTAEYNRDIKAWVARRDAGEDPGKKPTLRMEFNRIEQGLLMTKAQGVRAVNSKQCACVTVESVGAHHLTAHRRHALPLCGHGAQAFGPLYCNSAAMKVGAYPSTRQDMEQAQVRKGADDDIIAQMMDHNYAVCVQLEKAVGHYRLQQEFRQGGISAWMHEHDDVWKNEQGQRKWKMTEISINEVDPKTKGWQSTGACAASSPTFCFLSRAVLTLLCAPPA